MSAALPSTTLRGRRIVIVGGSSGIGRAIAAQAGQLGAEVTITGRDRDKLERAAKAVNAAKTAVLDAHDTAALDDFFASLEPTDHLVSMVGDSMAGGFLDTSEDVMLHVLNSKFLTNWRIGTRAGKVLNPGGSLTFTAGTGGRPHEISATYVANLGLGALVQGLAYELAPTIRVNAVAPTFMGTRTAFWRDQPSQAIAEQAAAFAEAVPLRRIATPDEVAATYLHLITNDYLTGQVVAVDGGVMLGR
ncbi:SDR family oxidoreductase [Kribbella sp. NPDC023855]|uniref:SDR family oxidoreductase n=1 Tax=Kribbella sp. NPDC023855 TaxID=3154698 RepID=UPI0034052471